MSAPVRPATTNQVPAHPPGPARGAAPASPTAPSASSVNSTAPPASASGALLPQTPTNTVTIPAPPAKLTQLPANTLISATIGAPLPGGRVLLQVQSPQKLALPVPWPNPPSPGTLVRFRLTIVGQTATLHLQPSATTAFDPQLAARAGAPSPAPRPTQLQAGDLIRGELQPPARTPTSTSTPTPNGPARSTDAARQVALRVLTINPPGQHQTIGSRNAILAGVIRASPAATSTTLSTAAGVINFYHPLPTPPGSQVLFRIESGPLPAAAGGVSSLGTLTKAMPSLRDGLDALAMAAPHEASQIRDNVLPTTGPRLAAGMLFFLSALSGGALQGWLGVTAARILQQLPADGRGAHLPDEFATMARTAGESLNGEWRATALPIFHGETLNNLRLFIHRNTNDEDDNPGTRFVVEADLTQIGPIQLDGLVRGEQNFDLTLRSTRPLSEQWRNDLANLFSQAGAAANFGGNLSFEVLSALPTPALAGAPHRTLGLFA